MRLWSFHSLRFENSHKLCDDSSLWFYGHTPHALSIVVKSGPETKPSPFKSPAPPPPQPLRITVRSDPPTIRSPSRSAMQGGTVGPSSAMPMCAYPEPAIFHTRNIVWLCDHALCKQEADSQFKVVAGCAHRYRNRLRLLTWRTSPDLHWLFGDHKVWLGARTTFSVYCHHLDISGPASSRA